MANVSEARSTMAGWMRDAVVEHWNVSIGGRETLRVSLPPGADDTAIPRRWFGCDVEVVYEKKRPQWRLGASPMYPAVVHRVRKNRVMSGGTVATWQCERGRGEVYGALLLLELPENAEMCKECFA